MSQLCHFCRAAPQPNCLTPWSICPQWVAVRKGYTEMAGARRTGHFYSCGMGLELGAGALASKVVRTQLESLGLWIWGPLTAPAPQRRPAQAVAVHGDQGAATLGHLVL